MNFLNPLFLFGLGAAALPILIHLFTRRRPREVRFSSLEFLAEVNQSEIRRLRIKQWLLLALRTLAVAALALALSRPALPGGAERGEAAATTVVALLDVSGSLGALGTDGKPLLAQARRVAEDVIAAMGPADELLIVPYDRAPMPAGDRPHGDGARLRAAAQNLRTTAHTTDHRAALEAAARVLADARSLNKELVWVSDFQGTGFATAALPAPSAWSGVRAVLVPLAPRTRANAALTDARLLPDESGPALSVDGVGHGVAAGDFALEAREVAAGGSGATLGRGFLSLPAQGEGQALLPLSALPEAGAEVRLPPDGLALDDRRVLAAGRAGTLRVVLREDGAASPLRLALEAGAPASGLALSVLAASELPAALPTADALVVGDVERLTPAETQAVLDFHRGGGGVLLAPGARADAAQWSDALLREMGLGRLGPLESAAASGSWRLVRRAAGHPVLEGFPARPGEPISTARFQRTRSLETTARVLLEHAPGRPALVEVPDALLWTAPLDAASGDLAVSGVFLPLVHQCARVLGRGTAAASLEPGDVWRAPAGTGDWRIVGEDGSEIAVALATERGATRVTSAPLERPGLYRILESGQLRGSIAVNPDPSESDLTARPEAELLELFPEGRARVLRPGDDFGARLREARHGRELWAWFLVAALALLVAESVLGRIGLGTAAPRPRPA